MGCGTVGRRLLRVCSWGLVMTALLLPQGQSCANADAALVSITISPHKLVLKAKGQFEDVQAVIRMAMPSGYRLSDFAVGLSFDGVLVSEAYAMRYCPVDDNFLASFDRHALQENPEVIAMAGSVVRAKVEGWYEAVSADGTTAIRRAFLGYDDVEIVLPGR